MLQVGRLMHRKKESVAELTEQGRWMDAPDLLKLICMAREAAEDAIAERGYDPDTIRMAHDSTLACLVFGYIPPGRMQTIWSLQHPHYQGPCLYPDCSKHNCKGNRLISDLSQKPPVVSIHLPHHKNDGSWDREPITYQFPPELAAIMIEWTEHGHPCLCQQLQQPNCPYVFMHPMGKPFSTTTIGQHWQKWVYKQGGPPNLPPSRCRHIFVDERMSEDRVEGPLDKGAAMAMGNSVEAWIKYYHKQHHFHPEEAQQAVFTMDGWRGRLKARWAVRSSQQHAPKLLGAPGSSGLAALVPSTASMAPMVQPAMPAVSGLASLVPSTASTASTAPMVKNAVPKVSGLAFLVPSTPITAPAVKPTVPAVISPVGLAALVPSMSCSSTQLGKRKRNPSIVETASDDDDGFD